MRHSYRSLREFEALRMLIATGTATAAARRLGISQSAVSRAITQLETRLGQVLFERRQGRMSPTADYRPSVSCRTDRFVPKGAPRAEGYI